MAETTIFIPDKFAALIAVTAEERTSFVQEVLALGCLHFKGWSKEDCASLLGISLQDFDKVLIRRGLHLHAPSLLLDNTPIDDVFFNKAEITPATKKEVGRVLIEALNKYLEASCKGFSSVNDLRGFRFRLRKVLYPFHPKVEYESVLELREIAQQASNRFFEEGRDREAIAWRELGECLKLSPEYFMTEEEIAEKNRSSKKIGPEEAFNFIAEIESGRISLEATVPPEEVWIGDVTYKASNGWELVLRMGAGHWKYISSIDMDPNSGSNTTRVDYDDMMVSMPDLLDYEPSDEVRWNIYKLPRLVTRTCKKCGFYFTAKVEDKATLCTDCDNKNFEGRDG